MNKEDDLDNEIEEKDSKNAEKDEEAKLKAKYPQVPRPGPGLLQKRLQKGQKYFDSGDYNMAKAAVKNSKSRLPVSTLSQPSQTPPGPPSPLGSVSPNSLLAPSTGDTIPTPDCLATRKTSIHVQSKLATGAP